MISPSCVARARRLRPLPLRLCGWAFAAGPAHRLARAWRAARAPRRSQALRQRVDLAARGQVEQLRPMLDARLQFAAPLAARIHEFGERVAEGLAMRGARVGLFGAVDPGVVELAQRLRAGAAAGERHEPCCEGRGARAAHPTTGVAAGAAHRRCAARRRPCAASAADVRGVAPSAGESPGRPLRPACRCRRRRPRSRAAGSRQIVAQKVAETARGLRLPPAPSFGRAIEISARCSVEALGRIDERREAGRASDRRGGAAPARRPDRGERLPLPPRIIFHDRHSVCAAKGR